MSLKEEDKTMPPEKVSATDFTRHFAKMQEDVAECGAIEVSSHGRIVGAFVSSKVLAELKCLRAKEAAERASAATHPPRQEPPEVIVESREEEIDLWRRR